MAELYLRNTDETSTEPVNDQHPLPVAVMENPRPADVLVNGFGGLVTITTGGTAQNAYTDNDDRRYLLIVNLDATEVLWVDFGTAAVIGTSIPIAANNGSLEYSAPGFVPSQSVSLNASTTAHKFTVKEG